MSAYPIAQQHLCDQFRAAITEALRAGVPLKTVQMALIQAHDELAMHAAVIKPA